MKKTLTILFALTLLLGAVETSKADPITYSGSLIGGVGGGIIATGPWDSSDTIFSWIVTSIPGGWEYGYTFTVPTKGISHLIIEVSPDTTQNDFSAGAGEWDIYSSTSHGNSNPGMPGEMTGLKINVTVDDVYELYFSFTSPRAPVWGDFYAKDGKDGQPPNQIWVTAWNVGFGNPDTDPTVGPHDGSEQYHILRPDTVTVPEPGILILLGIGIVAVEIASRRMRKI